VDGRPKEAVVGLQGAAPTLPSGTVTFVLGDVEGSVRLWESEPEAMAAATSRFNEVVSELIEGHGGVRPEEQGEGDSFVAAFHFAGGAVAFIVALQRMLHSAQWAAALPLRVRAALHSGAAQLRDSANYMGPTVNRCARIRALGHGGQVLLSGASAALVADELSDGMGLVDLGFHVLRDFDRPERVFQLVHPDLPDRFPPLRDHSDPRGLPAGLTSFVAREREMDTVDDLLSRERLVTLTGAGGSGKTRLALECVRRRLEQLGGSVGWADAAPIADGALLASCVAGAFAIREVPSEPLIETIVREIGDRRCVLVIDNCEHVIDDAARLVEGLLAGCPRLRVLATSREPLGVLGETALRVPSLDERAAVRLFVDRAQAVRSDFVLTIDWEDAVKESCRRLDGIPLAIELAAARVTVLTPRQIADGLADRFRLLTGGSRTALPRQRTLEASVDWSYRLLSERERTVLARLSVFAGGFTLTAARSVCSDDVVPEASILDLLTALVDKSLVLADGYGEASEARYRMLETIRHFARQRLADGTEAEVVRDRHLRCFVEVAEEIGPRIEQGDEIMWLDRLEAEIDNFRAALDWAHQRGESQLMLRLAGALWLFYEVRCRFEEGKAWLHAALAAAPERTRTRAAALHGLGDISVFTMDMETVVAVGEEALAIGEHLGDASVVARGLTLLGWAACLGAYRDTTWARESLAAVVERPEMADDPWLRCDATMALGLVCTDLGDLIGAASAFEGAVEAATRWRSVGSLQRALYFRGLLQSMTGEVEKAESDLRRTIELAEPLDDTFFRAICLAALADAKLLRGDLAAAESMATESLEMGDRFGNPQAVALGGSVLARTLVALGEDGRVRPLLDTVRPIADQVSLSWLTAFVGGTAALAVARGGDAAGARAILDDLAPQVAGRPYAQGRVALSRGAVERLLGDEASAEAAFTEAVGALAEAGARSDTAAALEGLGVSAARRDQHERAARLFAAADAERTRLGVSGAEWADLLERDSVAPDMLIARVDAGEAMSLDDAVRFALRGRGGRRRPASGWKSLTPTELEVVRLVSEGLTNPVIAAKLAISRGTVKVHLSHIFSKLAVASRAELAAEAARRQPPSGTGGQR
jgi:predicted ATPase/class 3 adenylate cyclase/DNA-binding NarL/FixJ family response regulator